MKTINDIITKDESEISLAKDAEVASNAAEGATAAVQANTRMQMAVLAAVKNQTAAQLAAIKAETDDAAQKEAAELRQFQQQREYNLKDLEKRKATKLWKK